jgi:hypothetical protein
MRWKLVILATLAVSVVTASAWYLLATFGLRTPLFLENNWFYLQAFILIVIINTISISIYRRTSKRRKIQAFTASMLTLFLIIGLLSFLI